jgi:phosphatidylinositol alpha-mannosyltransferase
LKKEKFEVLVIHEPLAPFLNWEVLNFAGTPKIGWFHATTLFNPWEFPVNLVAEPVQVWLKSRLAGVIAISASARDIWKKTFDRTGEIISGGVDIGKYAETKPADLGDRDAIKILFVGRLDERKGLPDLIRAMGMITNKLNLRLWVVGDGPQMTEVWKLAHQVKLGGKIRFVGRVSDDDLPGYFKAADIFCAPSRGGESLGLVLLEAMAAGAPIVACANPGYKYTLSGYPWEKGLVPVKSVKKLAEAIEELAGDTSLRQRLTIWETEKVKEFDWEVMTDRFINYAGKICRSCLK